MSDESRWTQSLSQAVADAAPATSCVTQDELDRVWNRVVLTMEAPARRPRHRKLAAGVATAVFVVGVGGTATAAVLLSARTGAGPVDHEDLTLGGPGERLDLAGDDLAQVIAEETRDIPFPTGEDRRISNAQQTRELQTRALDARVSVGALRGFTVDDALCAWANDWAVAVSTRDEEARTVAASALSSAESWPAVLALDTDFKINEGDFSGGNGLEDSTRFGYVSLIKDALAGRDVGAMGDAFASHVRCIPALVPDLPQALPRDLRRQ